MNGILSKLLRRPITAAMLVTSLSLLGIVGMLQLPLGLLPNLASPGITVLTRYPGVSSDAIERVLTIPIERELRDVASIETMMSSSSDGESRVHIVFFPETAVDVRMLDVREKLFQIEDRFPLEVEPPSVLRYDPSDRPVYIVSFTPPDGGGKKALQRLREIAEFQIKPRFERIRGVSEVFVGGGAEREIQVQVDPQRLQALNLSAQSSAETLDDGNSFVPSGRLDKRRSLVYTDAKLHSISDIAKLIMPAKRSPDGKQDRAAIPFTAFASVIDTEREPTSLSLSDGKERITLYVEKAGDANTLSITEACDQELQTVRDRFPELRPHVVYNQGKQINEAVSQVVSACIGGVALAVIILHLFLGRIGFTLVIGISIPASILTTFFFMFLFDIELNVMSLSGLALGAGMLIDASIVVSEAASEALASLTTMETNSKSGLEMSVDRTFSAIDKAVATVRSEVIASTLSTIIVFLPLLFADYETRALYRDFTLTVSLSLIVSMIFSLTVLPAFLIRTAGMTQNEMQPLAVFLQHIKMYLPHVEALVSAQTWIDRYESVAVHKRTPAVICIASFLAAAPVLFYLSDKEFLSSTESDTIEASIDLDPGIHLGKTKAVVQDVEERIKRHGAVTEINSKIENSRGTLTIKIDAKADASKTIEELHALTDGHAEAFVHYERSGETANSHELELEFFGEDVTAMKQFAKEFADRIQTKVSGVQRVILKFRDGRQDLVLHPYRVKNDIVGLRPATIGTALRQLIQGNVVTKYYDATPQAEREIDVRILSRSKTISSPEDVLDLHLPGTPSPLKTLLHAEYEESETRIFRKNRRRSVSLLIQFQGGVQAVARQTEELLKQASLPRETSAAFGDAYERMLSNQHQMIFSLVLSIVLVYILLAFLFENLLDPLIILSTIPLSLTAVLLLLMILRRPLNISVYIGFIMLGGIVVNNAILILAEIRSSRNSPSIRNYMAASFRRLRPILMTTATTVLGMAPLLFDTGSQSALWNALAITVTTGLVFSMPVALFTIPFIAWMFQGKHV